MPTTLEQIQYGFDRDSRRTWKRRALAANEDDHYRYDALSQVTEAARGILNLNLTAISGRPASEQSWDYDPTGNWRGFDAAENGNPVLDQHRVHDRGNRLTQIEDSPTAMVLDRAGRMRQAAPDAEGDWNGKLELNWDAWSRVTRVKSNGETVGEYAFDGLTRRTTRDVSGVTLHSYYSDAWRPLEERKDSEATATAQYLWGARHRDDLVRRDRAVGGTTLNETRYVLMDYFSAAAIADEDGEVKERYAYSAFGVRRVLTPEFTTRTTSECGFEFGFQGQFLDAESGLYNYGYRYYSPYLGRWACKDPIAERGGFNIFSFISNEPTAYVDRFGLRKSCCCGPKKTSFTPKIECCINNKVVPGKKCRISIPVGHCGTDMDQIVASQTAGQNPPDRIGGASCFQRDQNSKIPEGKQFQNPDRSNKLLYQNDRHPDTQSSGPMKPSLDSEIEAAKVEAGKMCGTSSSGDLCCDEVEIHIYGKDQWGNQYMQSHYGSNTKDITVPCKDKSCSKRGGTIQEKGRDMP